ncbi:MAG TPA: xanthine dehydrogenase family protein molybdopterin-binding subunit [Candidatus Methylacidiphilales bacterium]|nr:xanthine dehydrogenase family protein molybdopterin-binding subunit [Candidatus Methylacidiphilales bacterium]
MSGWPDPSAVLGKPTERIDGPVKVTGQAKYTYDVQPDGWLYGMILRSKWPAAKVTKIDLSKALAMPGVKAAVLAGGEQRQVSYYGQELAAVAATTKQACLDALRAIEVEADPLPFVVKEDDAMKPDAPSVFAGASNVKPLKSSEKGQVDQAFATAAAIAEGELRTPTQLHQPLETHGAVVAIQSGQMTAWSSTQGISSVQEGFAQALQLPQSNIRVICEYMGGGFGAKFGPGAHGLLAAQLARMAGAPVKVMLTRLEQGLAVGNRPSSIQKFKIAADSSGKLLSADITNHGSPGISGGGQSAGGGSGANIALPYVYKYPNARIQQFSIAMNTGASSAFRAPGHPPASYGTESMMDELAVKMGMDPLEFRLLNSANPLHQREFKVGGERFGWAEKYKKPGSSPGPIKTGIGCACGNWGGGGKGTKAEVQINPDGTVEVRCGTQDLGTGSRTMVAMVAAEALGLTPQQITVKIGDTNLPPSGGSGGSSTTASVAPAIWNACENALAALQQQTGTPDARGENWAAACKKLVVTPLTAQGEWQPGLSNSGTGGVNFAEVEVDTDTGYIRLKKIVAVHDCGLIVNPLATTSQINGGIIFGIGYALYEERVMDHQTGLLLSTNFDTYKISNIADMPDIEVILLDMPERGVIGIGEPAVIPSAGAIANAVANAIGVRVHSLPITPAKVLAALGKVPNMTKV